jgi:HEAT repeat protein
VIDPQAVVGRLQDLREGPEAMRQVVQLGLSAVPALEIFLRGPSDPVFQPRYLAADALAAIGGRPARESLLRALEDSAGRDLPPVLRFAEDAVVNRIAQHLGRRSEASVAEGLLAALRLRPYAECAAALGRLGEVRAVPLLVECLYDDFAREAARGALVELGYVSVFALSRVLLRPRVEPGLEGTLGVAARVTAAEALGQIHDSQAEYALVLALRDREEQVRVVAALALCARGSAGAVSGIPVLLESLGSAGVALRERVGQCLLDLGGAAEEALAAVAASRESPGRGHRRLAAIEILGKVGSRRAVGALTRLASDADVRARFAATSALARIAGCDATAGLTGFVSDAEPSVRMGAVSALADRDASAAPALARALGDSEPAIRHFASNALLRMGFAAVPALLEAIERARLGPGNLLRRWRVRRLVARALRTITWSAQRRAS